MEGFAIFLNMEGFIIFIGLIVIVFVFCILQIILFFKVWGMTNNVKDIRNSIKEANIAYLKGNIEEAEKLLNESFFKDISDLFYSTNSFAKWKNGLRSLEWRYKEAFKKIDKQAPDFEKYRDTANYL